MPKYNVKNGSLKILGGSKVSMLVTFTNDNGVKSMEQPFEVDSVDEETINAALMVAAQSFDNQVAPSLVASDIKIQVGKDVAVESNKPVEAEELI